MDDGGEFLLPFQVARTFGPVLVSSANWDIRLVWSMVQDELIYGVAAEYEML